MSIDDWKLAEAAVRELARYSSVYGLDDGDEDVFKDYIDSCLSKGIEPEGEVVACLSHTRSQNGCPNQELATYPTAIITGIAWVRAETRVYQIEEITRTIQGSGKWVAKRVLLNNTGRCLITKIAEKAYRRSAVKFGAVITMTDPVVGESIAELKERSIELASNRVAIIGLKVVGTRAISKDVDCFVT